MPPIKIRRVDFYPDDWLAGTLGMPGDEIGAYIQICALIYAHGGPVLDDESWLAKVCGLHWRHFRRVRISLLRRGKIVSQNGHVAVKRCAEELQRSVTRVAQSAHNGAKGGRPNGLAKPDGSVNQKPNNLHTTEDRESESLTFFLTESDSKNPKHTIAQTSMIRSLDQEFSEIWGFFIRKVGKGQALKAYRSARKQASFDQIVAGIQKHALECKTTETQYIPYPAKWLNGQRWLDEEGKPNGHDADRVSERRRPSTPAPTPEELNRRLG